MILSPQNQRLVDFLEKRGKRGATTWEIVMEVRITEVGARVSELRMRPPIGPGLIINCVYEGVSESNAKVFRYTLVGPTRQPVTGQQRLL